MGRRQLALKIWWRLSTQLSVLQATGFWAASCSSIGTQPYLIALAALGAWVWLWESLMWPAVGYRQQPPGSPRKAGHPSTLVVA